MVRLSRSFSTARSALRDNRIPANTPDSAPTMPAMVGTVAIATPDAIERALPAPETAMTSKTAIMPVTVPSRPSKGHSATIVLISGIPAFACSLKRDTRASRTCLAFHDCRSGRVSQRWRTACSRPRRWRLKKMMRSRINTHMAKMTTTIRSSTSPPSSRKSRIAAYWSNRACIPAGLRCSGRQGLARAAVAAELLGALGDHAGCLLLQNVLDASSAAVDDGMQEHDRDGDHETEHGGHERLRNSARHQLRVAGAEQRDRLKGHDHAGHGAEQAQQGCHHRDQLEKQDAALQGRGLVENRLTELELQRFRVLAPILLAHLEHPAERVAAVELLTLQLRGDLAARQAKRDQSFGGQQQPEQAKADDHVTDDPALLDALHQVRLLGQQGQDLAAGRVEGEIHHLRAAGRIVEVGDRADETALVRLARHHGDVPRLRCELEIVVARDDVEDAHPGNRRLGPRAVEFDDLGRETHHASLLGHLALQLEPQALDFLHGREPGSGTHLRREVTEERGAFGVLDVHQ